MTSKAHEIADWLCEATIDMELSSGEYAEGADLTVDHEDGSSSFLLLWEGGDFEVIVRPKKKIR